MFIYFTFLCRCWKRPAEHVQRRINAGIYPDREAHVDSIVTQLFINYQAHRTAS